MPKLIDPASGVVSKGTFMLLEDKADHRGLLPIRTPDNSALHVHPKRILPDDAPEGAAVVLQVYGQLTTLCPKCGETSTYTGNKAKCSVHGEYVTYQPGGSSEMLRTDDDRVTDLTQVRTYGELWTKSNLKFDHPQCEAKAHVLLLTDGSGVAKKLCFNSYSGNLGKHSQGLELKALLAGTNGQNGKPVGYVIKDSLEAERKRLKANNYEPDPAI